MSLLDKQDYLEKETTEEQPTRCAHPECSEAGEYPGPLHYTPGQQIEHHTRPLYCRKHIQEINKEWNFFHDMTEGEILAFQRDALTGHRNTKPVNSQITEQAVSNAYETAWRMRHMSSNEATSQKQPNTAQERPFSKEETNALHIMQLSLPMTQEALKKRFRELVKRTHPDRAGPEKQELFKRIVGAYQLLKTRFR